MEDTNSSGLTNRLSAASRDNVEMTEVTVNSGTLKNGHLESQEHEELVYTPSGWLETRLARLGDSTEDFMKTHRSTLGTLLVVALNAGVLAFFAACLVYHLNNGQEPLELCSGFGSLVALLSIVYFFVIYFRIVKRFFGRCFEKYIWSRVSTGCSYLWENCICRWLLCLAIIAGIAIFLYIDTAGSRHRLVSLLGICVILLLCFVFSQHPGRVQYRTVCCALLIHFVCAVLFIRWPAGRLALQCFSDKVSTFLSYGVEGAAFVFGDDLVREQAVFAFSSLPVIFFFSMLVEVLFYWGALQWFCLKLGQVLRAATGTTVCESVIVIGNMFLGMTESALIIKPYISVLTPSEIHVVMSSGFATVSGTILAAYIAFGAQPAHLVTASVLAAPAALGLAKLGAPETRRSATAVATMRPVVTEDQSAISAATRGATNGIALILNIIANLVAFVSFVAFFNGVMGYCGGLLGFPGLNLEWIFGKAFIPLAWVMGVPWAESEAVGALIGLKTVVNEFVAFQRMGEMKAAGLLSTRAEMIATYALCGFTNPSSAGILIGALSGMAPNQRETLSQMAIRAFFTGCAICFLNACMAGLLMSEGSFA